MTGTWLVSGVILIGSTLFASTPALGQTGKPPAISSRQFTGGSIKLTVTGSARIDQEIPINTQASYGDGEMTWLQFGASGSEAPNALITYGETGETGIIIGRGKFSATGGIIPGEESECSGTVHVTATLVSGQYNCVGVTSNDPPRGMGKVSIEVRFTAKS